MRYLNEELLGIYLSKIFPEYSFVHDKPALNTKYRPDYYCQELGLCVEFNGPTHYSSEETIQRDLKKMNLFAAQNVFTVCIPFFVQLTEETVLNFFSPWKEAMDLEYVYTLKEDFPHGFISKKCPLPMTFCETGTKRMVQDLYDVGEEVAQKILVSLYNKWGEKGDLSLVIRESQKWMIEPYVCKHCIPELDLSSKFPGYRMKVQKTENGIKVAPEENIEVHH